MAYEETGFGNPEDKEIKNEIAFKHVYRHILPMKTAGVLFHDRETKIIEIASPVGVVAAIVPSTNPTSTTMYKILISIKARNSIVISPHPAAVKCISETAELMRVAGKEAGLPPDSIVCMQEVTMEGTRELMSSPQIAVILATGSMGLVKSAYSSGKPAYGVGPGNVPVYVHTSASIPKAARDILVGKTFDNGTVCASEQSVVADRAVAGRLREEFSSRGAYFLTPEEKEKVAKVLVIGSGSLSVNPKMVGKSAEHIAREAGVDVPSGTICLISDLQSVGPQEPLSIEKLSPVLGFYEVEDWQEGCDRCKEILAFGGMGHTLAIHSLDEDVILAFGFQKPAHRICVNTPATHGAVGYSTSLPPSMTLGCGASGNNITSDNITSKHLIDVKRVAYGIREVQLPGETEAKEQTMANKEGDERLSSREIAEEIVDSFLSSRTEKTLDTPDDSTEVVAEKKSDSAPAPEEKPSRKPVDFVCEFDVRVAVKEGVDIIIDNKTIITPSAREVGERGGVFINIDTHY
jgi:acetaldehyde dehydrogenase (acetylating)